MTQRFFLVIIAISLLIFTKMNDEQILVHDKTEKLPISHILQESQTQNPIEVIEKVAFYENDSYIIQSIIWPEIRYWWFNVDYECLRNHEFINNRHQALEVAKEFLEEAHIRKQCTEKVKLAACIHLSKDNIWVFYYSQNTLSTPSWELVEDGEEFYVAIDGNQSKIIKAWWGY